MAARRLRRVRREGRGTQERKNCVSLMFLTRAREAEGLGIPPMFEALKFEAQIGPLRGRICGYNFSACLRDIYAALKQALKFEPHIGPLKGPICGSNFSACFRDIYVALKQALKFEPHIGPLRGPMWFKL